MISTLSTALLLSVLALMTPAASTPANAPSLDTGSLDEVLTLTIDPPNSSVVLGESLTLRISVSNDGPTSTPELVVHLDITDPEQATSVDPEDWTPTLSKPIGSLSAGDTRTIDWDIQPISGGTFAAYAVALSPGVDSLAPSNILQVQVEDRRSLDPGGILPVVIGAPTLVGALLAFQIFSARYRPRDR